MTELSKICPASGKVCEAREVLAGKITRNEELISIFGQDKLFSPSALKRHEAGLAIGTSILNNATWECSGEGCYVIFQLTKLID